MSAGYLRLADHRHRRELEAGECLARGQSCLGQVTFDAATTAIGVISTMMSGTAKLAAVSSVLAGKLLP